MNVAGVDVVLQVRRAVPVSDVILRLVRHLWPKCVLQDGDDTEVHSLNDPGEWLYRASSREFFIYQDVASAESWMRDGGTPSNQKTMLHFIIDDESERDNGFQVTVVLGELNDEIKQFIGDLRRAFSRPRSASPDLVAA